MGDALGGFIIVRRESCTNATQLHIPLEVDGALLAGKTP